MRIENGKAIYEVVTCWNCRGLGKSKFHDLCPNEGRKIWKTGCDICAAPKGRQLHNTVNTKLVECHICDGRGLRHEGCTDYDDKKIASSLPIEVIRSEREQTFNEAYLAIDCFYSVTDYGRHKNQSDADLINEFKNHGSNQYCKFVKDDGHVADKVIIACNSNGYSVRAVFSMVEAIK